jgi:membrane protease YdiL (CAAX protease family)
MPLWPSVILSALIFGVAHADIGSFAPLVIIGLALAWARWRSDSIWPGIVVHAINNTAAAVVLLPLLLK